MRLALSLCLALFTAAVHAAPADSFHTLLEDAWEWRLAEFAVFASPLGEKRYNGRWPDRNPDAYERRQADR